MNFGLIPGFFTGKYTVERSCGGDFIRGRYVPGKKEIVQIKGSLQPIGGRDIKQSTDGERLKDHFYFFSEEPLLTIRTSEGSQADRIKINNDTYRVMGVEQWGNQPGFGGVDFPHFKTLLKREPQQ